MKPRALLVRVAAAMTLAAVLVATLGGNASDSGAGGVCLLRCGDYWAAGFTLNVLLFAPLGAALTVLLGRVPRAVLLAALFSALIELTQAFLPGRYASPGDVLANTTGAVLGGMLWRTAPAWLDPTPHLRARLCALAAAFAIAVPVLTVVLVRLDLPSSYGYWGQWAARFGGFGWYRGRVEAVTLGGLPLPDVRLDETPRVKELLARGARLEVTGRSGPPTSRLAPVFSMADDWKVGVLMLAADGEDLVYRYRMVAGALGLEQPELRATGWLHALAPGSPLALAVWRGRDGYCLEAAGLRRCDFRFGIGSGWGFLVPASRTTARVGPVINALWLGAVFLPLGYWSSGAGGAALGLLAASLLLVLPLSGGLIAASASEVAGAVAGFALGGLLRAARAQRSLRRGTRHA